MRKLALVSLIVVGFIGDAFCAAAPARRTRTTPNASAAATSAKGTTAARAAVSARGVRAAATTAAKPTVSARAATTTVAKPTVSARAATTQKVVGTGTKVATAAKNIVVSEECQAKYEGCMDAFCMLDNDTGGRCLCSDKNAEYDAILAEIEKLDQQSYQMATFGVEKLEMGADADEAIKMANAAAESVVLDSKNASGKSARKALDLSLWDTAVDFDEIDAFAEEASSPIADKEGDVLHSAAAGICIAQMPECESEINMLQMMYAQRIKSDCTAYENSLKQQKNASQQKLYAAERALREAALEQYRSANKYDLGQCTVEFKKCMQTTGGCGNDFSGCASMVALDTTSVQKSTKKKDTKEDNYYSIQGAVTTIDISMSTYDALISKKPLCESVTKSCVAVKDQVWDTFLREVAPQIKSAELIAEDKARQDCIGNISSCFQKACKDNMDPNDPDGSYDMCLSRPGTMLSLCKIPLNNCGIDAASENAAATNPIWDFVVARLAAMRVDSCTTEVKNCLQSEDRCGEDYANCIGLDLTAIKEMCPLEKLVGCQTKTDSEDGGVSYAADWDNIERIVRGIWLNIDNSMLDQCQNLVNEKMLEICGDVAECSAFDSDKDIGTESLISYTDENGDYVIDGLISFGNVKVKIPDTDSDEVKFGKYEIDINDYQSKLADINNADATAARVVSALQSVATKINQKISILSQDPKIQMCIEGRDMSQISPRGEGASKRAETRFPHLLDSAMLAIISSGIDRANQNYTKKYNEFVAAALESKDDAVKSVLCAAMASNDEPRCIEYKTTNDGEAVCSKYGVGTFENVFADSKAAGLTGNNVYSTKYVISRAKISNLAAAQQNGHSEHTQVDPTGAMVGKVSMSAVYSASNNTCTLTTTSTMCKGLEAVITVDTSTSCSQGGLVIGGGGGCTGGGGILNLGGKSYKTTRTETFEGTICPEFGEPVTTVTNIKM